MLVKDFMTRHPIMIPPTTLAAEAQNIMAENKVRHLPVVGDGKRLLGLITRQQMSLKPDLLSSLNVWEITRNLAHLTVKDLMLPAKDVITITPDKTVERAAHYMTTHKIGCLPVLEDKVVVGIITEIDLLRSYQEMLGLPKPGLRITVRMPDRKGEFAKLMSALGKNNVGVMGVGTYPTRRLEGFYDTVLKVPNVTPEEIKAIIAGVADQEIVDLREAV